RADVVLQNVKVLGMDLNVDPTSTQSAVAHTATLEVSALDAQRLSVAGQIGVMSLALRRLGQAEITPVRTVDGGDVRSHAPRAAGKSYPSDLQMMSAGAHPKAQSGPAPINIRTRSVTIMNGEKATEVEVPRYGAGA